MHLALLTWLFKVRLRLVSNAVAPGSQGRLGYGAFPGKHLMYEKPARSTERVLRVVACDMLAIEGMSRSRALSRSLSH